MGENLSEKTPKDFFISYSSADRLWAEWIDWHLEQAGYSVELPDFGLQSGYNFALNIDNITREAKRIIAILSPNYIRSLYSQLDWALTIKREARAKQGLVLLVHVEECKHILKNILGSVKFINVVAQNSSKVQEILLTNIRHEYSKPGFTSFSPEINKEMRDTLKKELHFWQEREISSSDPIFSPVWNVPYQRNPFFANRDEVLERLRHNFEADSNAVLNQPQALTGIGGVGKTQIALEYAYRYRDEYQVVLWIQANSSEAMIADFVASAQLLNLPEGDAQDQSLAAAAVKHWLKDHTGWLLILDNVDDLVLASNFIPVGNKGHILLTTRAQALGTLARSIEVNTMSPEEGALFLLRRTSLLGKNAPLLQAHRVNRAKAKEISVVMDGLPLALDQAGAYIEETDCTLSAYLDACIKQSMELLNHRGKSHFNHPESVATTWSMSFEKIKETNPVAAELLRFCAFIAPDAIPEELIIDGAQYLGSALRSIAENPIKLDEAIAELLKYSLVRRNATEKTCSIHRLVQTVLKDEMNPEIQNLWATRVVHVVNHAFPDAEFRTWTSCKRYLPHALACAKLIDHSNLAFEEAARLLYQAASYLLQHAQYEQAEPLYLKVLSIQQKVWGPDHSNIARTLTSLAKFYKAQGKYTEAKLRCIEALTIQEKLLPADHLDIASSLNELGWLYRTLGNYNLSESHFLRALDIREKVLGSQHLEVAQTLNGLAWLYFNLGKYAEAERKYVRALDIRQQLLGIDHPSVSSSLNNLAWLYHIQGKYIMAEGLYQQALHIREQTLAEHPDVAQTLDNLGALYTDQGRYAEAERIFERALRIRKQTQGAEHPDIALSLNGLGLVYYAQGRYDQAEQSYQEALDTRRRVFGPSHPHVAQSLNSLAELYHTQGKYTLAQSYYKLALEIRELILGPEHPDVAQTLNNLAQLNRAQGEYTQAEKLYHKALAIRKKILGHEHLLVAQSLNNLAVLYRTLGKYTQAEELHKEDLRIRRTVLGANHLDIAQTLNCLARLYRAQGKYAPAEQYCKEALEIWLGNKDINTNHPGVVLILNNLTEIYRAKGQYNQALQYNQQAFHIQGQTLGDSHSRMAYILNNQAEIHLALGHYNKAETILKKALSIRKQALGPEHPYIAFSLTLLAKVFQAQGQYEEAEASLKEAYRIRKLTLDADHPEEATILNDLANLYQVQSRFDEAEPLYKRALAIREKKLEPYHPDMATSLNDLAELYRSMGQYSEAEPLYKRALVIRKQVLGSDHPDVATVLSFYANLLSEIHRELEAEELLKRAQEIRDKWLQDNQTFDVSGAYPGNVVDGAQKE